MTDFALGYDTGYLNGLAAGEQLTTADLDARDEQLARRIVALLLQHDYNQELVASVLRTEPYAERGIPRAQAVA